MCFVVGQPILPAFLSLLSMQENRDHPPDPSAAGLPEQIHLFYYFRIIEVMFLEELAG
jgi:hypothetical protein